MKIKKYLSLALALMLAFALAAPALAEVNVENGTEWTASYQGTTKTPTIKLTFNASAAQGGGFAFNPYKIGVKVDGNGTPSENGTNTVNDQFISRPIVVTNRTNVPLRMTASITGTVDQGSNVAFATQAPAANVTANQVFCYADFAAYDRVSTTTTGEGDEAVTTIDEAASVAAIPADSWLTASRLVVGTTKKTHTTAQAVEMAETLGGDNDPANYAFVKLGGSAVQTPAVAWAITDTFKVDYEFSFLPLNIADKFAVALTGKAPNDTTPSLMTANQPTFWVPYSGTALRVAESKDVDNLFIKSDGTTAVTADFPSGKLITVKAATGCTISNITFKDASGKDITTVRATKNTTTNYWTFTMPAYNIQAIVTQSSGS